MIKAFPSFWIHHTSKVYGNPVSTVGQQVQARRTFEFRKQSEADEAACASKEERTSYHSTDSVFLCSLGYACIKQIDHYNFTGKSSHTAARRYQHSNSRPKRFVRKQMEALGCSSRGHLGVCYMLLSPCRADETQRQRESNRCVVEFCFIRNFG